MWLQVVQQNKVLKRQSVDMFAILEKSNVNVASLRMDQDEEEGGATENGLTNTLNEKISGQWFIPQPAPYIFIVCWKNRLLDYLTFL